MFSRNQSSHSQRKKINYLACTNLYYVVGVGSDLTNSMKMDRNRTDIDEKIKNKTDLKMARSRSFHNPSIGFDFP